MNRPIKVRVFKASTCSELENKLNEFLSSSETYEINSIQYATASGSASSVEPPTVYTAMVVYEVSVCR